MQDRLLNAYLAGTIKESVYQSKSNEFKAELAATGETLANLGDVDPACGETALAVFDFTQKAADLWRGSNITVKREILDLICLNRALSDVSLVTVKRKPFDHFANRADLSQSWGNWHSFEPLIEAVVQSVVCPSFEAKVALRVLRLTA